MSERPILFSSAMVRAILEGRKTQTRRVVAKGTSSTSAPWGWLEFTGDNPLQRSPSVDGSASSFQYLHVACAPHPTDDRSDPDNWGVNRVLPRWQVGDTLWVRETWIRYTDGSVGYLADFPKDGRAQLSPGKIRWRASILMPRAAARIWLRVNEVRVQRVQDISEPDAVAEGVDLDHCYCDPDEGEFGTHRCNPRAAFVRLWDSLNGGYGRGFPWKANPWVWVITFKRELQ